jgi:hypothetical protein
MRSTRVALVVTMLALASSSAPTSGTGSDLHQLQSAEVKRLIAAAQKHNAYVEADKKDPARPVLRIQFRGPGAKDADLEKL